MKRITLLFIMLFIALTSLFAQQVSNSERLALIDKEIQTAVDAGNYDKAAQLKKEKELRLIDEDWNNSSEFFFFSALLCGGRKSTRLFN